MEKTKSETPEPNGMNGSDEPQRNYRRTTIRCRGSLYSVAKIGGESARCLLTPQRRTVGRDDRRKAVSFNIRKAAILG